MNGNAEGFQQGGNRRLRTRLELPENIKKGLQSSEMETARVSYCYVSVKLN